MASFHTQKALLNSVSPLNRQKNSSLSPAAAGRLFLFYGHSLYTPLWENTSKPVLVSSSSPGTTFTNYPIALDYVITIRELNQLLASTPDHLSLHSFSLGLPCSIPAKHMPRRRTWSEFFDDEDDDDER